MKVKTKQGIKEMKMNPEIIFRRAIAVSSFRTLLTVLSVPTDGAPLSMFHDDGSMRKPKRADWLMCWRRVSCPQHHGQRVTPTSLYILWTSCCFCVKHLHNTTASRLVSSLITFWHTLCDNSHMHTLLFASSTTTPRHYEVISGASLPKWNTVLEVDENKTTFSLFMSNYLEKIAPSLLQDSHVDSRMVP